VGLDPRWEDLPASIRGARGTDLEGRAAAVREFLRAVIGVVAPLVPVVKPNVAFLRGHGAPGFRCYLDTVEEARSKGVLVIGT